MSDKSPSKDPHRSKERVVMRQQVVGVCSRHLDMENRLGCKKKSLMVV